MRLVTLILLLALWCLQPITAQKVALRTNLLLWTTSTPNVGMEARLGRQFTLSVMGAYNAWKFPQEMKLNLYLAHPEIRYWFCRSFEGHFLGLHGQYGHFNIGQIPFIPELKNNLWRGDFYGGGLSYGYQWALGNRWGLEALIGAGYARLTYDKFRCAECAERLESHDRHFWGPTSAGISLIYFIR